MNRSEGRNSGVCVGFVLLANCPPFNIFLHKGHKTRPPELGGNQMMGFQVAWMTGYFMVVAMSKDGLLEGGVGGDINMALVGEDSFGILPVGQMRMEGRRNGSINRLQCLEDQRIRGRG